LNVSFFSNFFLCAAAAERLVLAVLKIEEVRGKDKSWNVNLGESLWQS
jgi:hypothetical protein